MIANDDDEDDEDDADDDDEAVALDEASTTIIWVEEDPPSAAALLDSENGSCGENGGSLNSDSGTATQRAALSTNLESAPVRKEEEK